MIWAPELGHSGGQFGLSHQHRTNLRQSPGRDALASVVWCHRGDFTGGTALNRQSTLSASNSSAPRNFRAHRVAGDDVQDPLHFSQRGRVARLRLMFVSLEPLAYRSAGQRRRQCRHHFGVSGVRRLLLGQRI